MKTILMWTVLCCWGTLSVADAQPRGWHAATDAIQTLIVEFGDELNLTEEQKTELIEKSLVQRRDMRSRRAAFRGQNRDGRDGEPAWRNDVEREEASGRRGPRFSAEFGFVREVLTDSQLDLLVSLRKERAEKQHNYRLLRHRVMVENAGIDESRAGELLILLDGISEHRKNLQILRVQNDGRDRSEIPELVRQMRDAHDEIKRLLTAAEYERLQRTTGFGGTLYGGKRNSRPVMIRSRLR